MNPLTWSYRKLCIFGAVFCFSSIGYALYVQYHMLMMPCPLCIFQRVAFAAAGVFFLVGGLHNPGSPAGRWLY
jgi:disulfide bond formation protein DsbB